MKNRRLFSFVYAFALVLMVSIRALGQTPASVNMPLPQTMRFCALNCFTLTLTNGQYDAVQEGGNGAVVSHYTVVQFTSQSVVLNRVDKTGGKGTITGKISASGDSLEGGKLVWTLAGGGVSNPGLIQLAWGSAIDTPAKVTTASVTAKKDIFGGVIAPTCKEILNAEVTFQFKQPSDVRRRVALQELPGPKVPGRFNLNGLWHQGQCVGSGANLRLAEYRVVQDGDHVKLIIATPGLPLTGELMYEGTYAASQKIVGKGAFNKDSSLQHAAMEDDTITVLSPDTLSIGQSKILLSRLSLPGISDAPCDAQDSAHVLGLYANLRAEEAIEFNQDYKKAVCWYEADMAANDPVGPALLALLYYQGLGVPQDYEKAFKLASVSAAQENSIGESDLALMYATGHGVAENRDLSDLYFERSRPTILAGHYLSWRPQMLLGVSKETPLVETGALPVFMMPPGSTLLTIAPQEVVNCSIEVGKSLTADDEWRRSQIAFAAGRNAVSACWALMSAQRGNLTAIHAISWFFDRGVGVHITDRSAIFWANKLAKTGDLWAEAKLSAIYQVSELGSSNPALASHWASEAASHSGGKDLVQSMIQYEVMKNKWSDKQMEPERALHAVISLIGMIVDAENYSSCDPVDYGYGGKKIQCEQQQAKIKAEKQGRQDAAPPPPSNRPLSDDEEISEEWEEINSMLHPGR